MRGKLMFGAAGAAFAAMSFAAPALAQTADPPGDSSTTARVDAGQTLDGEVAPAGDTDWYRLRVEQGSRYRLTLEAAPPADEQAIDTVLVVHSAAGEQIHYNDDSGGTLNSELSFSPAESGEVFVEARAFNPAAAGHYRLAVQGSVLPPDDAAGDTSTRARINPGTPANGMIEYDGDTDWYRLNTRVGQRYRISLNGAGDSALGDPFLRVLDSSGEELGANDDHESLNSYLEFSPTRNGEVFVEARAYADAYTGGYQILVDAERLPPDNASADVRTRGRLAVGQSLSQALEYAGDRDWYRIRLESGQTYRFSLVSNGDTPVGDPLLRLYDAAGAELAMDDDGGGDLNSLIEFTAPETANYFLEARGFSDQAQGGYTVRALAGDIPGDASTDSSLNAGGDFREGRLAPAGDKDWYRVDMEAGQALRIALVNPEGPDGLSDPMIVFYGPDGAEVGRDDDGGQGLNSWLEYQATASGPHYLEVRGFGEEASGRYVVGIAGGEIGADADTAEALLPGADGVRTSTIGATGDVDWFGIELVEGRPYRFNLLGATDTPDASTSLADPYIVLYNGAGEQVAADDDGGAGLNAYLSYASPTGGPHFVAVSSFGDAGTGRYVLYATDTDVPGHVYTDEFLDSVLGDERASRIDMPGDLDVYRVELEAGVHYQIDVRGDGEHPLADPFLTVLDAEGTRVTSDDDSGDGFDARLSFTPEQAGVFHIQASGLAGSVGSYQVSIVRR